MAVRAGTRPRHSRADWRSVLLEVLPHVDFFMPSVEETLYMLDRPRFDVMSRRARGDMATQFTGEDLHGFGETLLAMGAGVAMIKCGAAGIYARTAAADADEIDMTYQTVGDFIEIMDALPSTPG